ncbi:MAG: hypothetical protein N3A58_07595 [Spirochaetes bacterium]|nr:hypothetical protein [Spirochaetota bacterium]
MKDLINSISNLFQDLSIKQVIAYILESENTIPFFIYPSDNLSIIDYESFKYTKTFTFDVENNVKIKINFSYDEKIDNSETIFNFLNYFIISHYKNYLIKIASFQEELFSFFKNEKLEIIYEEGDFLEKIFIYFSKIFLKFFNVDFIKFSLESDNMNFLKIVDNNLEFIENNVLENINNSHHMITYHLVNANFNNIRFFIDVYLLKNDFFLKLLFKDKEFNTKIESILQTFIFIIFNFYLKEKYIDNLTIIVENFKKELELKNIKILNEINKATYIEKSREILFSNLYHELLTPLNSIIGFSNFLKLDDSIEKEFVFPIYHNALYLKNILLIIIDYSQFFTEKNNFLYSNFKLLNLIEDLKEILLFFNNSFKSNINLFFENLNNDSILFFDYNKLEELLFATIFFLAKRKVLSFNIKFTFFENFLIEFIINNQPSLNSLITKLLKTLNNKKFIIEDNNDISEFAFIVMHEIFNFNKINFKLEIKENEIIILYEFNYKKG